MPVGIDTAIRFVVFLMHVAKRDPGLNLSWSHGDHFAKRLFCIFTFTGALITTGQIEPDLGIFRRAARSSCQVFQRGLKIFCSASNAGEDIQSVSMVRGRRQYLATFAFRLLQIAAIEQLYSMSEAGVLLGLSGGHFDGLAMGTELASISYSAEEGWAARLRPNLSRKLFEIQTRDRNVK